MKIKEVINALTNHYQPEDEVLIAWWDKEWAENDQGHSLSNKQWIAVVKELESLEIPDCGNEISNAILEVIKEDN
jgi:hypothetical protein